MDFKIKELSPVTQLTPIDRPIVFKTLGGWRITRFERVTGYYPKMAETLKQMGIHPLEYYGVVGIIYRHDNATWYLEALIRTAGVTYAHIVIETIEENQIVYYEAQIDSNDFPQLSAMPEYYGTLYARLHKVLPEFLRGEIAPCSKCEGLGRTRMRVGENNQDTTVCSQCNGKGFYPVKHITDKDEPCSNLSTTWQSARWRPS